jgi:hypothetical protein
MISDQETIHLYGYLLLLVFYQETIHVYKVYLSIMLVFLFFLLYG